MTEEQRGPRVREGCVPPAGRCRRHEPGHVVHWIQVGLVSRSPWQWRDGVVLDEPDLSAGEIEIGYVDGGRIRVWHHQPLLGTDLQHGSTVRVHERYSVLDTLGAGVLAVATVDGGLGPLPDPEHPELWIPDHEGMVTDLATGRGIVPR